MIAVFAAMEQEIKSLIRESRILTQERWNDTKIFTAEIEEASVLLTVTGVGKVLTAAAISKLLSDHHCSASLFIGIAGAINESYKIGDMVLAEDFIQWDLDASPFSFKRGQIPYTKHRIIESDRELLNVALNYTPSEAAIHTGRLLSGDTFLTRVDKQQHEFLRTELEGDAADMEAASAALTAKLHQVPFLAVKIISDQVDGGVPRNFAQFIKKTSDRLLAISRYIIRTIG
jgi:adenosylhomocysteine nucleosidase